MEQKTRKKSVIALGNFDGLHIGHQKVILSAVEKAIELECEAKVLIFTSHPAKALGLPVPKALMSSQTKKEKIQSLNASAVEVDFEKIKDFSCETFVDYLVEEFGAIGLCCGFNYHFGKNASGNAETLKEICEKKNIKCFCQEEVDYNGNPVSSSIIRKYIEEGNITEANRLLGDKFSYNFQVIHGEHLGRTLEAPTINQVFPEDFIVPLFGVYASQTQIGDCIFNSLTNIGIRPTVDGTKLRSETTIIGFSGDLYGKNIKVSLIKYIRSERKFSSLEKLKKQIEFDKRYVLKQNEKDGKPYMEKLHIKAVFFDFDDTLQSRKGAYRLYCEAFLDKYFPTVGKAEREQKLFEMEEYVDGGYKDREEYFPKLIDLWKWDCHPPLQELYDSFNEDYGKYVVMLPHAISVLEEIKQRGYIMGIISNGVSVLQNTKLDTAGIRDMFDVVVVSGDFGVYKPNRSIFDEACRQAGVKNEECLFVGDHPINDIQGALGADMKVVRINQGDFYNQKIDNRLPTIEDLRELLTLL